jgi:hypothetical protein
MNAVALLAERVSGLAVAGKFASVIVLKHNRNIKLPVSAGGSFLHIHDLARSA